MGEEVELESDFFVFMDWVLESDSYQKEAQMLLQRKNGKYYRPILGRILREVQDPFIKAMCLKYGYWQDNFRVMLGKKILDFYISTRGGDGALALQTEEGYYFWELDADCCSVTWFADLIDIDEMRDAEILDIEEWNPEPVDDGRTKQEYDRFYGIRIYTTKGVGNIIFRNSSNGYYGGDISGAIQFSEKLVSGFTKIEGNDWSAD